MAEFDIRDDTTTEIDTIRFACGDVISNKGCCEGMFCVAADGAHPEGGDEPGVSYLYIKDIPDLIKALQKAQELWATK